MRPGRSEHLGTYREVKRVGVVIGGHVRRLYSLREKELLQDSPVGKRLPIVVEAPEGAFFCWDLELGIAGSGYLIGLPISPGLKDFQRVLPCAENQVQDTY